MVSISRRNCMRWGAALGVLGTSGCGGRLFRPTAKGKVVVIGGGFAGATASKYLRLIDAGIQVTLVEKNHRYYTCPGSNQVIAGLRDMQTLSMSYATLQAKYGVQMACDEVVAIDPVKRVVTLEQGRRLEYDRLILAPGIDFIWNTIDGYDAETSRIIPHAWKAGEQTLLLRRQLEAMPDGGVVLIAPPANPYRCPPGPYERASLIAWYLKRYKPRSKILIVDSKTKFSKQNLFMAAWERFYPGMVEWVSAASEGDIDYLDVRNRMLATEFGVFSANVINLIPPQKAGAIAEQSGLVDSGGWCPVSAHTFESTLAEGIHIIGDACRATPMPKSGFSANSQAKACAMGIVDLLNGREPRTTALINTCYSLVTPKRAISVSGVYRYSQTQARLLTASAGVSPADADQKLEARYAESWYQNMTADVFR